jgi:hypothetical protein
VTTERIVFGGGDAGDVELGTHAAVLDSIVTKQSESGDFRAWTFKLADGATVGGSSSLSMHPQSKGGRWAVALLGRTPANGEDITEAIIGKPCLVSVIEGKNGWPKVSEVMARQRGEPVKPIAAAPVDDLDELPFDDLDELPF